MRKTRCGRCHRARLVYKVEGVLGWAELCHACREELRLAALSAARDEVVRVCGPLVVKLDECRGEILSAFLVAALHGAVYAGPTYWAELDAARAAVAALAKLEKP